MRRKILATLMVLLGLTLKAEERTAINAVQISVDQGLSHTDVLAFAQDRDGYIWIGTYSGLCRYDGTRIDVYNAGNSGLEGSRICALLYAYDRLYIGSETSGVTIMDPASGNFLKHINLPLNSANYLFKGEEDSVWACTDDGISRITSLSDGYDVISWALGGRVEAGCALGDGENLLLTGADGLFIFNTESGKRSAISPIYGTDILKISETDYVISSYSGTYAYNHKQRTLRILDETQTMAVCRDASGTIWAATVDQGVIAFSADFKQEHRYQLRAPEMSMNSVVRGSTIFCDESSVLWFGSIGAGCLKSSLNSRIFALHQLGHNYSESVTTMYGDAHNRLWASSLNGGLYVMEDGHGMKEVHRASLLRYFRERPVSSLFEDSSGQIWIGSWEHGFISLSEPKARLAAEGKAFSADSHALEGFSIFEFEEDPNGLLWVSTNKGIICYSPQLGRITAQYNYDRHNEATPSDDYSTDLMISRDDEGFVVWAGSKLGVTRFICTNAGEVQKIDRTLKDFVSVIMQDSRGEIWVATLGSGLFRLQSNPRADNLSWECFSSADYPFPNDEFESLKEDSAGNLWIGGKGLIRFNPATCEIRQYTKSDGLQSNVFKIWDSAVLPDGRLAFGGINGINVFRPEDLKPTPYVPKVRITALTGSNGEAADPHNLKYTDNNLTFEFAAMDFENPDGNRYRFKLTGADKDWRNATGLSTSVQYLNLAPGNYSFIVYGANSDGMWNPEPAKLDFRIKPPFYATPLAFIIYCILVLIAAVTTVIAISKHKERQQQLERNRDELKLHTDFLHEIKTPLTLISAPVDELLRNPNLGKSTQNRLKLVQQSARILNKHIEELTDFRKMDNNKIQLHVTRSDIAGFVRELVLLFKPVTDSRKITLDTSGISESEILLYFDRTQMEKVIINLMSNAVKFSPEKGGLIKVSVSHDEKAATVKVSNLGIGILPEDIGHIFDRFRQGSNNDRGGMGIGLAISKHIIDLHSGTISVKSIPGGETVFELNLLLNSGHFPKEALTESAKEGDLPDAKKLEGLFEDEIPRIQPNVVTREHTVLIVDDNDSLRNYFCQFLSLKYNVLIAKNGQEAYERAIADQPDIILSDVVMPVMDGLELCSRIKGNPETAHIPVILISARDLPVHKIEGFHSLADDYFTKPFNSEVLLSRIDSLISIRENIRKSLSSSVTLEPDRLPATPVDERFTRKCIQYIEKNISDGDYGVDELCADMGMSRPQFYRRIKSITGLSAIQFIRSIRLRRAAQLLKSGSVGSVSDAMFAVGFNNLSYFSKIFFEEFGILPKDYR
ncbi:MAG: two-component regulator propeller domain-containing protein [Candidatus Cryptobacteroides sp.]